MNFFLHTLLIFCTLYAVRYLFVLALSARRPLHAVRYLFVLDLSVRCTPSQSLSLPSAVSCTLSAIFSAVRCTLSQSLSLCSCSFCPLHAERCTLSLPSAVRYLFRYLYRVTPCLSIVLSYVFNARNCSI